MSGKVAADQYDSDPDDHGMAPPEFFEHVANDCHCCPDCEVEPPCDGCCAGGICDHSRCTCGEEDEPYQEDDE